MRRLHLVQTPAPQSAPAQPVAGRAFRFDASRPAPQTEMLRAAWLDGETVGHRSGYMLGWRWGLACGTFWAAVGTAAALATYLTWWA